MKTTTLKNGQILAIAHAAVEDAEQLAEFANKIKTESKFITMSEEDGISTANSQMKWVQSTIDNNKTFIFSAKINGKIVGNGNFGAKSNKIRLAHRCDMGISVLKEYWNLGIASEIMKEIVSKAKEAKYEQIELHVVDTNESAKYLYTKFGFYETGYIKNGMKYNDGSYAKLILMQKDLIKTNIILYEFSYFSYRIVFP